MGLMKWYDSQAQPSSNLSAMDVRKMTPADRERIRHTYANQHPSGLPVNPSVLGCEMSVLDGADNMGYSGTMGTTRSASAVALNHQTARTTSSSPRTSAASNFLQNFKRSVLVY
ncbi:unnamed protein product [Anisakis simplex]|uniref:Transcription factor SOX-15 n=1 Tax=Anisakis simplex TaxID=6269 RepID=A0A0M3JKX2_ANISI|nr:unnamed protein product [Anisakis simplex]